MDPAYEKVYRKLYEQHWWWRSREAAILDVLKSLSRPNGFGNILDVGCGDGLFFDQLQKFGDVEGVEFSAELLDANGPHRAKIHVAPFDERFLPRKQYGLITMLDVLEHLTDPVGALAHAARLLEGDGILVVTVPAFNLIWTTHDDWNHHQTRYTKSSFRSVAEKSGVKIRRMRYWYQWPFPAKLLVRVTERIIRATPKNPAIPSPPINRSLYLLSRAEQKVFTKIPAPFGSSLMVIGSK